MRSEEEIKEKLQWLLKAVDDEDNQSEISQVQLWTQINFIKWLGVESELVLEDTECQK